MEQLADSRPGPPPQVDFHPSLSSFSSLSLARVCVLSFSVKHNGRTDGGGWGCRPSRLSNVLKVKSRARCVCVCPVPVADQIKQLSVIPRWDQMDGRTDRQTGRFLSSPRLLFSLRSDKSSFAFLLSPLLSSSLVSSPLIFSSPVSPPLLSSPLLSSPLLSSPLLSSPLLASFSP